MKKLLAITLLAALLPSVAKAVSVGKKAKDNSVKAQLAAFRVHEDFEVSLFADESLGIANPVAMHWDGRGRLWVLTTLTYAQLEPGENPNDTLVVLEDTDEDGKADRSTVFAEGLDMPMGFALAGENEKGGTSVYLGEGPDLLLLSDEDGDGQADRREVVLTGFGTGDTHQNISNFTWGPDGCLYFAQGLHCFSRVETPWGIVRGDTAGFWRFHPESLRLEPFCFPSNCTQNPCGIVFDRTGALFIKSNNKELIFATPGLIATTHPNNLVPVGSIGATPGKSMGGEYVDSTHLPDWIQDHILIAGYYSHRVTAFPLVRDGAGYAPVEPVEVLFSEHGSFRPVEVRVGPDGAIYVADWFNPIIGHYQASLRHPDRDEAHGRVWRITAKERPLRDRSEWTVSDPVTDFDPPSLVEIEEWVRSEDPRKRLEGIVWASRVDSDGFGLFTSLHALDRPRDRFIDYALEQTVHALAPRWVPALKEERLTLAKTEHLAYALETLGGSEALEIARGQLGKKDLSEEARISLGKVLARSGTPEDLLGLLEGGAGAAVLSEMERGATIRRAMRPAPGYVPLLRGLCESDDPEIRLAAIRLAGTWRVKPLEETVRAAFENSVDEPSLHAEAARAVARIEGGKAVDLLLSRFENTEETGVQAAIAEATLPLAPGRVSQAVVAKLVAVESNEQAVPLLRPFLGQKGASAALLETWKQAPPSKEAAGVLVSALSSMGGQDEALLAFFQDAMGVMSGARAYSPDFVQALVAEAAEKGDPVAGEKIYQRAELTCVACHQLDGVGGIIGPSLDAVGAGLTPDLLVESVLWPQRQLKEGYLAIAVTTKGGATFSGYREREHGGVFYLRDTASDLVREIPRAEITRLDNIGSLMPPGLTNSLSREELRDLIAYLASLKG